MADVRLLKGGIPAVPGGAKLFPKAGEPTVIVMGVLNLAAVNGGEIGTVITWDDNPGNTNPTLHYTVSRSGYADVQVNAPTTQYIDSRGPFQPFGEIWQVSLTTADGTSAKSSVQLLSTPPTVDAGGPYSGQAGDPIQLAATVTPGDDAAPVYAWTEVTALGGVFSNPALEDPTFTPDQAGSYILRLTVTSAYDPDVTDDANLSSSSGPVVTEPTVEAGGPYEGNEDTPIQLNATVTPGTDPSPTLDWKETTILGGVFNNANIEDPTFTPATTGLYLLTLTATPNDTFLVADNAELASEAVTDSQETNPFTIRISA